MPKKIPIEVLSQQANITLISFRLANDPYTLVDVFTIWIDLVKPLDGLSGFCIDLPVKKYTKEDFLKAVKQEADRRAQDHLNEMREDRVKDDLEERVKRTLGEQIKQLKTLINMD